MTNHSKGWKKAVLIANAVNHRSPGSAQNASRELIVSPRVKAPFWGWPLNLVQWWTKGDYKRRANHDSNPPKTCVPKKKNANQLPKNYVCVHTRSLRPKIIVKGRVGMAKGGSKPSGVPVNHDSNPHKTHVRAQAKKQHPPTSCPPKLRVCAHTTLAAKNHCEGDLACPSAMTLTTQNAPAAGKNNNNNNNSNNNNNNNNTRKWFQKLCVGAHTILTAKNHCEGQG